jgi:AraC-like DNA-binding protein
MLVARSSTAIRSTHLRHVVCFSRPLCAVFVDRTGLVFDTRFVPGAEAEATASSACLYILLQGVWRPEGGEPFVGPVAFVLSEAQLEGAAGARPFTFRAWGDPYVAIELRVTTAHLTAPLGSEPRTIALDDATWAKAREAATVHQHDDSTTRQSVVDLVRCLADGGVLRRSLVDHVSDRSPGFERLWDAMRPIVERLYASPSLQELSAESGLSIRQLTRELTAFVGTFSLVKTGWRAVTKRLRLKLAVLFLSADDVSIGEIARTVGYGSSDAMARAFRDAGLPSPSDVQASVRQPASPG